MNISIQGTPMQRFTQMAGGLKSTQQKLERQEKCASQVAFFEQQKDQLKNMQCTSLDEIAKKLDMLHGYEDQIAAAKQAYNDSQMMCALDEARERGEKIAEAAEKTKPKTEEERKKDQLEEATGNEESKGMLSEVMEEVSEITEEMLEEMAEENTEMQEEMAEENAEMLEEDTEMLQAAIKEDTKAAQATVKEDTEAAQAAFEKTKQAELMHGMTKFQDEAEKALRYQHIDYMV